jgi:spermidine/putrescine transport system substrate-binding protein
MMRTKTITGVYFFSLKPIIKTLGWLFLFSIISININAEAKELKILAPKGYFCKSLVSAFEKKNKTKILFTYYQKNTERFILDSANYDLLLLSENNASTIVDKKLAHPLSLSLQAENAEVDKPKLREIAMLLSYQTLGLAYKSHLIETLPTTWLEFFWLKQLYREKVSIMGDSSDIMDLAIIAIGADISRFTEVELISAARIAMTFFQRIVPKRYLYENEFDFVSSDAILELTTADKAIEYSQQDSRIKFYSPGNIAREKKEYLLISLSSKNTDEAMDFIEMANSPHGSLVENSTKRYHHKAKKTIISTAPAIVNTNHNGMPTSGNIEFNHLKNHDQIMEMRKNHLFKRITNAVYNEKH